MRLRRSIFVAAFALLSPLAASGGRTSLEPWKQRLQNNTLIVRNFYEGTYLHYDRAGKVVGHPPTGSWTISGFVEIRQVEMAGNKVHMEGVRLAFTFDRRRGYQRIRTSDTVVIEITLEARAYAEPEIVAILTRIFLTSKENLAWEVPAFWQGCLPDEVRDTNSHTKICGGPLVPDLGDPSRSKETLRQQPNPDPAMKAIVAEPVYHAGENIIPPQPVSISKPEFGSVARALGYQGNCWLFAVIGRDGIPQHVHIYQPAGVGLDEKAVEALRRSRFKPAMKGGVPVSFEMPVHVNFGFRGQLRP